MAFLDLPALPKLAKWTPKLVRFGGDLTSTLGGPTQRIIRLGSRWAFQIDLPTMDLDCARAWIATMARAEAEGSTLRLALPQPDGAAITGRTAGAGAGSTMAISSAAGISVGQFFSFVVGGHSYLHQVTEIVGASLGVAPLLRVNPNGQALQFAAPVIEGFAPEVSWTLDLLRFVGQSFTLTEDR